MIRGREVLLSCRCRLYSAESQFLLLTLGLGTRDQHQNVRIYPILRHRELAVYNFMEHSIAVVF